MARISSKTMSLTILLSMEVVNIFATIYSSSPRCNPIVEDSIRVAQTPWRPWLRPKTCVGAFYLTEKTHIALTRHEGAICDAGPLSASFIVGTFSGVITLDGIFPIEQRALYVVNTGEKTVRAEFHWPPCLTFTVHNSVYTQDKSYAKVVVRKRCDYHLNPTTGVVTLNPVYWEVHLVRRAQEDDAHHFCFIPVTDEVKDIRLPEFSRSQYLLTNDKYSSNTYVFMGVQLMGHIYHRNAFTNITIRTFGNSRPRNVDRKLVVYYDLESHRNRDKVDPDENNFDFMTVPAYLRGYWGFFKRDLRRFFGFT